MTDRLFKFGSVEDELMKSMQSSLVKNQKDEMYNHEKLSKAVDLLNAAAEIFDDAGFSKEAEAITKLIEGLAHSNMDRENHIKKMIEESLPEYKKSPINKMIEEELTKKDIEEMLAKKDISPKEKVEVLLKSKMASSKKKL